MADIKIQAQLFFRHVLRRSLLTHHRVKGLQVTEKMTDFELSNLQAELLRLSIQSARSRLPQYASLAEPPFGRALFDWVRGNCNVVTKAELVKNIDEYYPNGKVRHPWWPLGKTSGTSGSPLEVYRSIDSVLWEEAFHLQFWAWAGYEPGDNLAVLRGDQVVPPDRSKPPYWFWDRASNQLYISTRHLTRKTAAQIINALQRREAVILRAYPSSAFELAKLASELNYELRLKTIVTGSEPLYPVQRDLIEHVFGCQVFDFYGMAERIAFAAQCEHGYYHLNSLYSWVEILDENGEHTDDFGYVVGTTFRNYVMPLLRYKISDKARWMGGVCPCGRNYPRIEISSGKVEDQLYDAEENVVSASLITFAFKGVLNIKKSQVAQVARGEWEIRLVPDICYSHVDGQSILNNITRYVSNKVRVRIHVVEDISLMPSGKFKWVSQEWYERGKIDTFLESQIL